MSQSKGEKKYLPNNQNGNWKQKPKGNSKPKIEPLKRFDASYGKSAELKGGTLTMIIVSEGAEVSSQLLFHHPIGVSKLQPDDWVCTDVSDVQHLVMRKEDPDAARTAKLRRDYLLQLASETPALLKKHEGRFYYPDETSFIEDNTRNSIKNAAEKLQKKELAKRDPEGEPNASQGSSSVDDKPRDILSFFPRGVREKESNLRAFLTSPESKALARKKYPTSDYETRSGNLSQNAQKALGLLKGRTANQVKDALVRHVLNLPEPNPTLQGGGGTNIQLNLQGNANNVFVAADDTDDDEQELTSSEEYRQAMKKARDMSESEIFYDIKILMRAYLKGTHKGKDYSRTVIAEMERLKRKYG
jgi:hypothetical protein